MNAELLLKHFDRISEAPDAVARLRRFILDLAVRGKLVAQDPTDEPAVELLREVLEVNPKRVNSKTLIRTHALPSGWTAVALGWVLTLKKGKKPQNLNESGLGYPYLDIAALERGEIRQFTEDGKCPRSTQQDLMIVCDGSRSGLVLNGRSGVIGSTVASIEFVAFEREYLRVMLNALYVDLNSAKKGAAIPHLNIPRFLALEIGLPPRAEQHRIVAKVDELMALCDQLAAAKNEREAQRDRLVAASLHRIGTAPENDAAAEAASMISLRDAASFHLDHLPRLTTRFEHVKQLRQAILNLAVRGRLVPQDPGDEPASELLKRIAAENKKLLSTKNIRSQKLTMPIENFEASAVIPASWMHVYLQDLAYQITDGTHLTPKYVELGKPFLSAQNVKPFKFMPEKHRFVSEADFDNYRSNRRPERGDVLMTRVGAGIGEAAVLNSDFEFAFYVSLCLIKIPNRLLSAEYLVLWLNSPEGRDSSTTRTYGKGASQGNLNLGLIRTFKIPLPPLAEQHRIVAKVDELMALCDQLETQLAASEADSRRLLEAVLHDVLAPALEQAA